MRRFGMFIAMQFYNLAAYDEVWDGNKERLLLVPKKNTENWQLVRLPLQKIGDMSKMMNDAMSSDEFWRTNATPLSDKFAPSHVSSIALWENIFGFLLWQYHVLYRTQVLPTEARADLNMLKDDALWEGIAPRSLFATYLKGSEPSALLNTEVRTTCCFSKDVPGLMQCGFCPLK